MNRIKPTVLKCAVCKGEAQGYHFRVLACAACTAFFRRVIKHKKSYSCLSGGECLKNVESFLKCRACKLRKCFIVGMDKNAVQCNRDVIGVRSMSLITSKSATTSSSSETVAPPLVKSNSLQKLNNVGVFESLKNSYATLNRRRQTFYGKSTDENEKLVYREFENFEDAIFSLHHFEPRLCALFINENFFLTSLPSDEKRKIFSHFASSLQGIEGPYMSWQFGDTDGERCWVMPNKVFMKLKNMERYFDATQTGAGILNIDKTTAMSIHELGFNSVMNTIDTYISKVAPTLNEFIFVLGLIIYDPTMKHINPGTKSVLLKLRNMLMKEFLTKNVNSNVDCVIRLDEILWMFAGVKEYTEQLREDMLMFRIFDVFPTDALFDEIWGVKFCDIS